MRILCDQCEQPICGTVKKLSGNFNLHPDCLAQFTEDLNTSSSSTRPEQEFPLASVETVETKVPWLFTRERFAFK